ncbi:Rieske (2Fe-2S) protein [Halorussus lipolyticus]|uniref:Rieske (2Fe-2S) protein n=1 Tax=Halorussus lipolyticus TaxID=3034024 RepID=UPI0023E7855F|nr:Rieske 2Fe-2S domain-containing protein [Halorussus sp. DT80]
MEPGQRITAVENVPDDTTFLFTVRDEEGEEDEAILTRLDGEVTGWINRCMHFQHIRLDKGSGAPKRNGELVCANHGALFADDTGRCTHGPCEGAYLNPVETEVRDGAVYLTADDYEFVGEGGIETDPTDLSSKSNIEF